MDFQKERVDAHNTWPTTVLFKGEQEFAALLATKGGVTPFSPIKIGQDKNPDYQRCVAHLLDGLDALPYRPDYFFDHSFRILDLVGTPLFPAKGIKGLAVSRIKCNTELMNSDGWVI